MLSYKDTVNLQFKFVTNRKIISNTKYQFRDCNKITIPLLAMNRDKLLLNKIN